MLTGKEERTEYYENIYSTELNNTEEDHHNFPSLYTGSLAIEENSSKSCKQCYWLFVPMLLSGMCL